MYITLGNLREIQGTVTQNESGDIMTTLLNPIHEEMHFFRVRANKMHNFKYLHVFFVFVFFYCVLIPLFLDQKNERAKNNGG